MELGLSALVLGTATLSLIGTMIQKRMLDMGVVRALKADMKKLQAEAKTAKNDVKKLTKITTKQLDLQKQLMGHTMKPALISSLPVLAAFILFGSAFSGVVLYLPFALPWIGNDLGWFGIFICVSIISTMIFRKLLGLDVFG